MKKWKIIIIFVIAIGAVFVFDTDLFSQKKVVPSDKQVLQKSAETTVEITKDMIFQGDLLLVNKEYPIQEDSIKSDILNVYENKDAFKGSFGLLHEDIRLSETILQHFSKMVQAAEGDGVNHFIISSGYRDFDEQASMYAEMGEALALPAGYSEHNVGLSLDVGSSETKMESAPEGRWLQDHAWKYGFIIRYPEDKTTVTGIQYEPWHIRYVGLPHSIIMQEKNLVLEEYIELLKSEGNLTIHYNRIAYSVTYYPISQTKTIYIPEHSRYEISGNNIDGVIVTVEHGDVSF
jgi:zinc D-Ala-D-Ala carboxypeptidase